MNLMLREYEKGIIDAINSGEYPLEVKRLVVKEVLTMLEVEVEKAIYKEREANLNGKDVSENQLGE